MSMLICPSCGTRNKIPLQFCSNCGVTFAVQPKKSSVLLPVVLVLLVSPCALCGILGAIGGALKPADERATAPSSTSQLLTNTSTNNNALQTKQLVSAGTNKTTPISTPKPDPSGVTMTNYNRIKTGMTYSQVVALLGKEGEELSSNAIGGYTTVMYKWNGDSGWGANLNVMFQNNKVVSKAQFGLN